MKLRLVTMILLGALLTGCAQNTETTVEASQTEGMISTEEVSQSESGSATDRNTGREL